MLNGFATAATEPKTAGDHLMEWKELRSSGGLLAVYRAKVPGGWFVYACDGYHHHGGLTFYPDPHHTWTESSLS